MRKRTAGQPPVARERLDAVGFEAVCADLADGKTLTSIASAAGVSYGSLHAWLNFDAERSARAREARQRTACMWDEMAAAGIEAATTAFQLAKAKELAHHYRWRASKIAPKEYGEKVTVGEADALAASRIVRIERVIVAPSRDGLTQS
jgi:hypothetical protein